jgi:hypothetical protein
LVNDLDAEKLRLSDNSTINTHFCSIYEEKQPFDYGIDKIKRIVKECRRELPEIDSISFSQLKEPDELIGSKWSYAIIDIHAKGIHFRVSLDSDVNDTRL